MRRRSRPASGAPIPKPICGTARWRRCRCTKRSIPATTSGADRALCRARRPVQIPVHRQGWRLGQQELSLSADKSGAEPEIAAEVPRREDPHPRHGGVSALSPRDRHRRHLGRDEFEDGQARQLPLSRHAPDGRKPLRAGLPRPRVRGGGARIDPRPRDRRPVRRQVFLPRRAGDPAAASWRQPADRDRRFVLGRPPDPRQDHRRRRLPRRARNQPGALSSGDR